MNLIANEHKLDLQQEKAIYELTLKKQRSKKSTVSQKQAAAMQQLANELITQRKDFQQMIDHNHNHIDNHHHHHHHQQQQHTHEHANIIDTQTNEQSSTTTSSPTIANLRQSQLCRCTKSTISSSFTSTNSTASSTSVMSEETTVKLNQLRLEQLNNELERRLHQYEYLVAQEKAILGAYKMSLFTNESVNNFHLFHLDHKHAF